MIGGKIVDASALAALIRGRLSAVAWFATAEAAGLVLYLPMLALAEVRAVRPDAGEELAEVMGHSMIVLGELDAANARQVDRLSTGAGHPSSIWSPTSWPHHSAWSRRRTPGSCAVI